MKKREWFACTIPERMLEFVRGRASDRKLRLFACACCRRLGPLLTEERLREAIRVAEQFADDLCSIDELSTADASIDKVHPGLVSRLIATATRPPQPSMSYAYFASYAPQDAINLLQHHAFQDTLARGDRQLPRNLVNEERAAQVRLIHCIFGNPYVVAPALTPELLTWNHGAVRHIAQAIYEDHRFAEMPILADALEEAGCERADFLSHCRSGDTHGRGCWVIDQILGKE